MLFIQVAAHEYAHAWQGEKCPVLRDILIHEGFAEWAAYRILGHYGYGRAQARMRERDDIYGQGLRWALDLEAKQGTAKLIEACRRPG
jgi:aminopeptidase N